MKQKMKVKFTKILFLILIISIMHTSEAFDRIFPAVFNLTSINGTNGCMINGVNKEDWSGTWVRSAGDINGDGIEDVIIDSKIDSYVIFGTKQRWSKAISLTGLNGANGFRIERIVENDDLEKFLGVPPLGSRVSRAGDFNADGIDDIIIGSDIAQSYVIFGNKQKWPAVLKLSTLNGNNGFALSGGGWSVSGAGDVNGDGIDDVIIGVPSDEGKSYVVFGSKQKWAAIKNLDDLSGKDGFIVNGINQGDQSGFSVSNAGDVNGDGIADILIGTGNANQAYVVFGSKEGWPAVIELYSLDGSNGFAMNGIKSFYNGYSVSVAGDVNGDGIDDILIGTVHPCEAFVIFGSKGKWPAVVELKTLNGNDGFIIHGSMGGGDLVGLSVGEAGDFNADNITDILIGHAEARGGGQSHVIFGSKQKWPKVLNATTLNGNNGFTIYRIRQGDDNGYAVSGAGDVNGDGIDDIIIGAPSASNKAGQSYIIFGG